MAAMEGVDQPRMSVGRVFARAFSTIKNNPLVVLVVALTVVAIPTALMSYLMMSAVSAAQFEAGSTTQSPSGFFAIMLLYWAVSLLIGAIAQGALTTATVAESEGRKASLGESFSAAVPVLLPLVGVGLLYVLGIMLGMILLIVPGIILMVMWSVAVPALVIERGSVFDSFRRSRHLTKGARWRILGAFVLLLFIYWLVSVVVGLLGVQISGAGAATGFRPADVIIPVILGTLITMIWGTVQPSIYVELRQWKEGTDVRSLEDVFA
ncbi:MAG: hypothetical protein H0T82_04830 [Sphingomonas sp.]|nr:hypothetical protein [Sphingomonas sp.]